MLYVLLLVSAALRVRAWRRLHGPLVSGAIRELSAVLRYAAWALTPRLLLIALILGAVGTEELTGLATIPEPAARAAVLVAAVLPGFAIMGWVAFLIMCRAVWRVRGPKA